MLNLELMEKHKFTRAKKNLKFKKKLGRVKMNKQNVELYVDKVLIGLKATIFWMVYNRLS